MEKYNCDDGGWTSPVRGKKKKREILKKIHLRILKTAQEGQYVLQPNCLAETASPPL